MFRIVIWGLLGLIAPFLVVVLASLPLYTSPVELDPVELQDALLALGQFLFASILVMQGMWINTLDKVESARHHLTTISQKATNLPMDWKSQWESAIDLAKNSNWVLPNIVWEMKEVSLIGDDEASALFDVTQLMKKISSRLERRVSELDEHKKKLLKEVNFAREGALISTSESLLLKAEKIKDRLLAAGIFMLLMNLAQIVICFWPEPLFYREAPKILSFLAEPSNSMIPSGIASITTVMFIIMLVGSWGYLIRTSRHGMNISNQAQQL